MQALTSRINKTLLTPHVRRLRQDFDTLIIRARRPAAGSVPHTPVRIRRLELRKDYADGGVTLGRMLDEGRLVGSDDGGGWGATPR